MPKFQVGDIVKRINDFTMNPNLPVYKGSIHKVTKITEKVIRIDNIDNPFNVGNFELEFPIQWCIKGGDEMSKWQRSYMEDKCNVNFYYEEQFYSPYNNDNLTSWAICSQCFEDHTEITFKQFKKYIINKMKKPFISIYLLKIKLYE